MGFPVTADGKILNGALLLESRHSGFAKCKTENGKYTFIDKKNNSIGFEFDSANPFRKNYAQVELNKKADALHISGFLLSDISYIVSEIENHPENIEKIPDDLFVDKNLVLDLLNLAEESAKVKNDEKYL